MTDYFIGIDGGGSKTVALVAGRDGEVLGRGQAGSSNYQTIGAAQACAALEAALAGAFAAAGLKAQPAQALVLGLAGVDRPEDRAVFEAWARDGQVARRLLIANDAELVLAAGTPEGWGVALISGTGSICVGRSPDGRTARAGGWGPVLGDEGSGYAIGMAALAAMARAADGRGPATALTGLILAHWSLAAPDGLFRRVYLEHAGTPEIAALAPLVDQAAGGGDAVAAAIIAAAGRELALAIASVARQLGLDPPIPCGQAGGVLIHSPRLAAAVMAAAADLGVPLAPVTTVVEPARGALRLALDLR